MVPLRGVIGDMPIPSPKLPVDKKLKSTLTPKGPDEGKMFELTYGNELVWVVFKSRRCVELNDTVPELVATPQADGLL